MPEKVMNLHGTCDNDCPVCRSWLEHWEKLSGKRPNECSACSAKATVGGHVKKIGSGDMSTYITPLCDHCNARDDVFTAYEPLVSACKCK